MPPSRRTSIAARASSRWTESDRAALERARTRVHARDVAEGANSRLATSRDRTDGASPSSRAPKIFRHTVREAFGEWLPAISRDALSRARENVPPANATRDVSRSRSGPPATTAPDVSVATLAKVRAWVRAWRAKTKASVSTRLVGGEGRDVEKNSKKTDSVFVSTNARAAARVCADPLGAPRSRYAGYVTRCAHLAFGGSVGSMRPTDADQTGYFEEETGRWIPARATRRVVVSTETETDGKQTRRAAFVFCPACHDAFLVRALTRCDPSANACHACGSRVPRSATIVQSTAGEETTCVFCAFSLKVKKKQSRSMMSVEKTEKELETTVAKTRAGAPATTSEDDDRPKTALDMMVATSKGAHLEPSEPSSTAGQFALGRPACAFLDAEDVPGLDALRRAVAGAAPPVALAWDAEARRARNAETDARWRVPSPSLPGSSRVARNAETDAPGDETNSETNWGFLHAGMPPPLEADDFPARHASSFR